MQVHESIILGVVEGLTEFIPVSSTGHLIIARDLLKVSGEGIDPYLIIIQSGALLGAMVYYAATLKRFLGVLTPEGKGARGLLVALMVAAVPAVVLGLLFEKKIDRLLFGTTPVAWALITGGVLMVLSAFWKRRATVESADGVGWRRGLVIGLCQCLSLWPGMSRSMTTILGGKAAGLDLKTATDFSFLLSMPILGGASVYKMVSHRHEMSALIHGSPLAVAVGWLVAAAVGLLSIHFFLRLLNRFGLWPYGVYRILLGSLILGGVLLAR